MDKALKDLIKLKLERLHDELLDLADIIEEDSDFLHRCNLADQMYEMARAFDRTLGYEYE